MNTVQAKFIRFQLCGQHYLLPMDLLIEIHQNLYLPQETNLKDQPWVMALLNVRGLETIILNSYKVFSLQEVCFKNKYASILTFSYNGQNYGLLVEDILGVVDQSELEVLDRKKCNPALYKLEHKIVQLRDEQMTMIDIDKESLHIFISNQNDLSLAG